MSTTPYGSGRIIVLSIKVKRFLAVLLSLVHSSISRKSPRSNSITVVVHCFLKNQNLFENHSKRSHFTTMRGQFPTKIVGFLFNIFIYIFFNFFFFWDIFAFLKYFFARKMRQFLSFSNSVNLIYYVTSNIIFVHFHFSHRSLPFRLVKVFVQSVREKAFVFFIHPHETLELLFTPFNALCFSTWKGLSEAWQNLCIGSHLVQKWTR